MNLDLLWISIVSVFTFFVYAIDKHNATVGAGRVPEALMVLMAFFGGAFGALCSMILFNHKTRKPLFLITVPVALVVILFFEILFRRVGLFS